MSSDLNLQRSDMDGSQRPIHMHRHPDIQAHKHPDTHKHPDIQTPRHTNIKTHKHPVTKTTMQTHKHPDTQTSRNTNTQTHKHPVTKTTRHNHLDTQTLRQVIFLHSICFCLYICLRRCIFQFVSVYTRSSVYLCRFFSR